jgi:ureidoacrylate peracid hydrolase
MHTLAIPKSVIDRVTERRGREHAYDDLDPAKSALVVVDMQNAFMLPGVAHSLCPMAEKIVPNINRLAQAVRDTGGTVFWIKTTFTEEALRSWSTYFEMTRPERVAKRIEALTADSLGHALWSGLDVRPQDPIVEKNRFSAFIQGSSDLGAAIRARGLDTILVTGTVTNVCCESTARDAMMLNFKTIMVTDANAAATDEDHNASLIAFYLTFGDIMSTDMLIGCLKRNAGKPLERLRNPGQPLPHSAESIIGRRFAPTRWLHGGYEISTAPFPFAVSIARQIVSEVAGIGTQGAPIRWSASLTAFMTAGSAPTVPDSPAPLTPSGLVFVRTSFSCSAKAQNCRRAACSSPGMSRSRVARMRRRRCSP